ncbi:MAG: PASTA domain-containing protein [Treponema sp.]|nr:PASTA domain-containing protein [Treponema sp.]
MDIKNIVEKAKESGNRIKNFRLSRVSLVSYFESLQANGKSLVATVIAAFLVMVFFALVVFFLNLKGPEEVMVPEVKGKELTEALLEMQKKELYPKITLRYSEVPGDKGTILDQSPSAGSIVKGYSRVALVVSRGVIVDHVENYVGQNFDELKMNLQTLFAGSANPLIVLAEPSYKPDLSAAGTILEQDPPEGTKISDAVTLNLVVSRGPTFDNTRVPRLVGTSVNDMLQTIARSRIVFDFTSHTAEKTEKAGTVVSQQEFEEEFIPNYSRMALEMAFPSGVYEDNVYGIFSASLASYPYPVPMRLDATTSEGNTYTLVSFMHTGGSLTLPYAVPSETTLTLYVVDKEQKKVIVH